MKKTLRKSVSLLCALAMAMSCLAASMVASAAVAPDGIGDVTMTATATASSATEGQDASKAIDGDRDAYWNATGNAGEWLEITWDSPVSVSVVVAEWGGGNPTENSYAIKVMYEGDSEWSDVAYTPVGRYEPRGTHYVDGFILEETAEVVGIRLDNLSTTKNEVQLWEVDAYGDADYYYTFTAQTVAVSENSTFVATNVSADAIDAGKVIKADYTITRNGTPASGSVIITQAWDTIVLGENVINSEDIARGREGDYVTGVMFTNVAEGDEIVVTFSVVDAE